MSNNFVGDLHWRELNTVQDGDEFHLDKGAMVQVSEEIERKEQDLSAIWNKGPSVSRKVRSTEQRLELESTRRHSTLSRASTANSSLRDPKSIRAVLSKAVSSNDPTPTTGYPIERRYRVPLTQAGSQQSLKRRKLTDRAHVKHQGLLFQPFGDHPLPKVSLNGEAQEPDTTAKQRPVSRINSVSNPTDPDGFAEKRLQIPQQTENLVQQLTTGKRRRRKLICKGLNQSQANSSKYLSKYNGTSPQMQRIRFNSESKRSRSDEHTLQKILHDQLPLSTKSSDPGSEGCYPIQGMKVSSERDQIAQDAKVSDRDRAIEAVKRKHDSSRLSALSSSRKGSFGIVNDSCYNGGVKGDLGAENLVLDLLPRLRGAEVCQPKQPATHARGMSEDSVTDNVPARTKKALTTLEMCASDPTTTQSQDNLGPWSREAFDLFGWQPGESKGV